MARRLCKQPNGLLALFSTIVDDFVAYDCTPEDILALSLEDIVERETERLKQWVSGESTRGWGSFEDTLETIAMVHGQAKADRRRAQLAGEAPPDVIDDPEEETP